MRAWGPRATARAVTGLLIAGGALLIGSAPAHAQLSGPCSGTGTDTKTGAVYNPSKQTNITIPRQATIKYVGKTQASGQRVAVGEVQVVFPPPIGAQEIGSWGKNGKKTGSSGKSGSYTYDFSDLLAGIKVKVQGQDKEPGLPTCSGYVIVSIAGKSPARWATLAVTVLLVPALALSVRAKKVG